MKERSACSLLFAATVSVGFCLAISAPLTHLAQATASPTPEEYLSPGEMALSADGTRLFVVCEQSKELLELNSESGKILNRVSVGNSPRGLALAQDGKQIYVSNSWDDTISVIDSATLHVTRELKTGAEPSAVVPNSTGTALYVANRISNDISIIDSVTGAEKKRLLAGRGSSFLTISPDGSRVYGTHIYPNAGSYRTPPESEITVIDTARETVRERIPLHNIAGVFHIASSDDSKLNVVAQLNPKNLVPLAHVAHGWAIDNSLTVFGEDVGTPVQVPIDELERYTSLPYDVVISHDKRRIYVSASSSDSIAVIDTAKLLDYIRQHHKPFENDLSATGHYLIARINVGKNPRGMVISKDDKRLLIANRFDDSISVIDTAKNLVSATFDLGGPKKTSAWRKGQQNFYSAKYAFQGQFSCANCHIDSTFDALSWDLEPDGFGKDIVDNRNLEDVKDTEPYKWNGGNPDLPTECGPRTEKYFFRSQGFDPEQLAELALYIRSLPARPNRFGSADGKLTPAQERGKTIYFRIRDKRGNAIPIQKRCAFCHSGPKYTNKQQFDVGTGKPSDRSPVLDVPQLTNIALTSPYLHDGSARTLEEIWTIFNPNDIHEVTNDLTKDELNDLIEYLRTL